MGRPKRPTITGEPSGLFTFPKKEGKGEYKAISNLVMTCMGVQDFFVLAANHDRYFRHKHKLYKQGTFYLSFADCEIITGFNRIKQEESYSNIYGLSLLVKSGIPGPDNAVTKWINIPAASIWSWIIYRHWEALKRGYKDKNNGEHLPRIIRLKALTEFYRKTLKDKRRKNLLKQFFEEMKDCSAEEIKSGRNDERLESFYDELIGRKHKKVKYKKVKKSKKPKKKWRDTDGTPFID